MHRPNIKQIKIKRILCLISDKQARTLRAVVESVLVIEIPLPTSARLKRLAVVQIEHDKTKVRRLVIYMSHVDVALLAAYVPELQVERAIRCFGRLNLLRAELDAYCRFVRLEEDVIDVSNN